MDKNKFGYEFNEEIAALERQIAHEKGLPINIFNQEVFFEARKRYEKRHANDETYAERSRRMADYEPQFPNPNQETIDLTRQEIDYMLDKLFGVNDEIGINLKNKLMRKM